MFYAKRVLWTGLLFVITQLPAAAEEYTDGPAAMYGISWTAEQHFARSNFEELDKTFIELSESQTRFDDGRWPIAGFTGGIVDFFVAHKEWDWMKGNIAAWKEHNNLSPAAAIVEAQFWITYAWNARGEGYANTVTSEGWKLFRERLEKAREVLDQSKNYAAVSPLWYDKYLSLAVAQGWPRWEVQALFDEAIAKEPYYHGHYFSMTRYLQPRWHGDYYEIEKFARQTANATKAKDGMTLYARIYWYLNQLEPVDFKVFEDSQASWEAMRDGFQDLMTRYPKSYWNMNNFAAFACRAGDKDTYWTLRPQFNGREFHMAWPSNLAVEVCDERMKD